MSETKTACPLCWFDIPADDLDRARRFYEEVFGFDGDVMNEGKIPYVGLKGSAIMEPKMNCMGGIRPRMQPGETPLIYFQVPSLEEWHPKVEAAGGKVLQPKIPVADFGIFSLCLDTEGNSIAIWENLAKSSC